MKSKLSNCCKSSIKSIIADEGTGYYQCGNCGMACNEWVEPKNFNSIYLAILINILVLLVLLMGIVWTLGYEKATSDCLKVYGSDHLTIEVN